MQCNFVKFKQACFYFRYSYGRTQVLRCAIGAYCLIRECAVALGCGELMFSLDTNIEHLYVVRVVGLKVCPVN